MIRIMTWIENYTYIPWHGIDVWIQNWVFIVLAIAVVLIFVISYADRHSHYHKPRRLKGKRNLLKKFDRWW